MWDRHSNPKAMWIRNTHRDLWAMWFKKREKEINTFTRFHIFCNIAYNIRTTSFTLLGNALTDVDLWKMELALNLKMHVQSNRTTLHPLMPIPPKNGANTWSETHCTAQDSGKDHIGACGCSTDSVPSPWMWPGMWCTLTVSLRWMCMWSCMCDVTNTVWA